MTDLQQDDPVLIDALKAQISLYKLHVESLKRERDDAVSTVKYEREANKRLRAENLRITEALEGKIEPLIAAIEKHIGTTICYDGGDYDGHD